MCVFVLNFERPRYTELVVQFDGTKFRDELRGELGVKTDTNTRWIGMLQTTPLFYYLLAVG